VGIRMEFDYCEMDWNEEQHVLQVNVGCRFADEPEELYVIVFDIPEEGSVKNMHLMFNGMDCKYAFKEAETAAILHYVQEAAASTEYAERMRGAFLI